ncbi:alpha-mannosidase [[Candida] jaroonii]|uniref:Alpha-mannosidase n=1 Tax=[Candida] jaroonii TaxID=467808 RepID=A0ACA9YFC9_9ASCO|nr:alpha-mannosidase [[Candida] jaroonii]
MYEKFNLQPNLKPIDHLYESRLRQFINTGGQYPSLNLPKFYDLERFDIPDLKVWKVPDSPEGNAPTGTNRPLFKDIDFDSIEWQNAKKGDNFGPSWKTFWFKFTIEIPEKWLKLGQEIDLEWDCNNEGMIYNESGLPLQAFSGGGERTIFKFPDEYLTAKPQIFYLEISCNGMFGISQDGNVDPNRYFNLSRADVLLPNLDARGLYYDFWILSDAARELPSGWQKYQAADICNKIMNTFDPEDVESIKPCRELAATLLSKDISSDKVFSVLPNENSANPIDVYAVGNCHIDTAWLWPFAETKRKIVRSWTSQIKIAEEYPEYIFVASQMQQFKWLKMYHPEIFKKVKEKFTTNQFLPIGGSWVENDTNLPNGESLIRQFLLGQRFQINEFGLPSTIYWLPDTFGYSSQIPQICQTAGIEKFLTQKLSWNNINSFPLSTFNWAGIDGSQVLVHMPPANTYTALANFGDIVRSQHQHKNMRDVPTGLLLYGRGDGGGGPTEEMIEKIRRTRGFANKTNAIPTAHLGKTVEDFYEDVMEKSNGGNSLPTWRGEIYLEFHRGTYTTQADVKKWVRQLEIKVHDLEYIATLASVKHGYKYPAKEIREIWEDLCLCQFHDVIPGSCIGMVYYDEVKPMLKDNLLKAEKLIDDTLESLKGETTFFNSLPWERNELVEVEGSTFNDVKATKINDKYYMSVNSRSGPNEIKYPASVSSKEGIYTLSNELLKAEIDDNGVIRSIYDIKNDREIIDTTENKQSSGGGNQLLLFDDEPLTFEAWDTEIYSLEKFKFLKGGKVTNVTNNSLKSSITVKHEISKESSIETEISIEGLSSEFNSNNYIKFKCNVEWHEFYKFLKVQFPTTIYTAQEANYETQFGITKRPTHYNTTWDAAKFEVCHHKFMDLSEYNYGVSVINNCKYGASIHGNLMRLSLLRSPKAPDNIADMGSHEFEYAIYPHAGYLGVDTVKLAYNFNYKLDKLMKGDLTDLVKIKSKSIILSQLKRSEDDEEISLEENIATKNKGSKSFIIRCYESLGGKDKATITVDLPISKVLKVDSLENKLSEIEFSGNSFDIQLRGFEITSYKVIL